jgi:hypothetical protein
MDSDVENADSKLYVEFYTHERKPHVGQPFVRIMVPGDKTNILDQPVREDHKQRFPVSGCISRCRTATARRSEHR